MIAVDCGELTADEQLALAARISDGLDGDAIALVKGREIVLDQLSGEEVSPERVEPIVREFISRRRDAQYYSLDVDGERMVVHSADPVAAAGRREQRTLPPNLKVCPHCSFVTPYQEEYDVHLRSHYFTF